MVNGEEENGFSIHYLRFTIYQPSGKLQAPSGHLTASTFMRRLTSHLGITLLALLLCGWGEAMTSVLCPHAAGQGHACCPEKSEGAPAGKHHSASHHQQARGAKSERREHASHHRTAEAVTGPAAGSSCAHCLGRRDLPAAPASVRELTAQKSGAGKVAAHATKILAQPPTVLVSRLAPTQHAPPGPAGRRRLLLSVFLI